MPFEPKIDFDFIGNGAPQGELATQLADFDYDLGYMRPYFDSNGQRCVTLRTGVVLNAETGKKEPKYEKVRIADLMNQGIHHDVFNSTSLRKDEWVHLDTQILLAARQRLRAWADLVSANS